MAARREPSDEGTKTTTVRVTQEHREKMSKLAEDRFPNKSSAYRQAIFEQIYRHRVNEGETDIIDRAVYEYFQPEEGAWIDTSLTDWIEQRIVQDVGAEPYQGSVYAQGEFCGENFYGEGETWEAAVESMIGEDIRRKSSEVYGLEIAD